MVEFDKDVTTVTTKFVVTTVTTKFVVTVVTTDGLLHPSSDCYNQVRCNDCYNRRIVTSKFGQLHPSSLEQAGAELCQAQSKLKPPKRF